MCMNLYHKLHLLRFTDVYYVVVVLTETATDMLALIFAYYPRYSIMTQCHTYTCNPCSFKTLFLFSVPSCTKVNFTQPVNSPQLRALSYYLILFPSLDVMSAYPLTVICIANNVYMALTGRDTSEVSQKRYDWILRLVLRIIVAVLPLLMAFGAANLVFILQYAGQLGFAICFLFPVVLQLRSIHACNKIFGPPQKNVSINVEKTPLLKRSMASKRWWNGYMTPYSNVIVSHPLFVVLVACFGFCFFVISFVGFFIQPDHVSCTYR